MSNVTPASVTSILCAEKNYSFPGLIFKEVNSFRPSLLPVSTIMRDDEDDDDDDMSTTYLLASFGGVSV